MSLANELTIESDFVTQHCIPLERTPTDYTVILGYHKIPADTPLTLKPIYDTADIVLHEQMGWQPQEVAIYNKLSFSNERTKSNLQAEFNQLHHYMSLSMRRGELIAGSHARQGFWDVANTNPIKNDIVVGRTLGLTQSKTNQLKLIETVIKSDILALSALRERIRSADKKPYKSDRRQVVIHAGLAHVLLFNAIRQASVETQHEVTVIIPFDTQGAATLSEQDPSIQMAVEVIKGNSIDEGMLTEGQEFWRAFRPIAVKGYAGHITAKKTWELVRG